MFDLDYSISEIELYYILDDQMNLRHCKGSPGLVVENTKKPSSGDRGDS
jgi:hypothetical protein